MDKWKPFLYFIVLFLTAAVTYLIIEVRFDLKTLTWLLFLLVFLPTLVNLNIGFVIIIVSMLFSPEVIMGSAGSRQIIVRIEDVLLAVVVLAWFTRTAVTKNIGETFKTELTRPFFLYFSACILSTVLAVTFREPGSANVKQGIFTVLKYLEYFMLFLMVKDHLKSLKQAKMFLTVFSIVALVVAIYGHVYIAEQQQAGSEHFRVTPPVETRGGGEAGTLGGYLLFMMAMAGGVLLYTHSVPQKVFLICLLALTFRSFLYTMSRGSYLGFIAMVAGFTFFIKNVMLKMKLIYALAVFFILLVIFMPQMIRDRIMTTLVVVDTEKGSYVEWEESPQARIDSWEIVFFDIFPKSPLFGHGVATYFVDNQWFLILAEAGLIGVILFIQFLAKLFKIMRNILKDNLVEKDGLATGLCVGFLAGFVGLLVFSLSANSFIIIKIMEPFWFMAAIILSMPQLLKLEEEKIAETTDLGAEIKI